MTNTSEQIILDIYKKQKDYFKSGETLDVDFRRKMLKKFLQAMEKWEQRLADALWTDLHKSYEEAYLTELSIVTGEIRNHIRHISGWAGKKRAHSPIKLFPSRSYIVKEPLGNTLIISPWNYPVQLLLNPLVGAISAGCTAILKPSPYVPNVSKAIEEDEIISLFLYCNLYFSSPLDEVNVMEMFRSGDVMVTVFCPYTCVEIASTSINRSLFMFLVVYLSVSSIFIRNTLYSGSHCDNDIYISGLSSPRG